MQRADAVFELHLMGVAGPAAVAEVFAFGEEGAEHAVLHVKHRHVLVQCDFKPAWLRVAQQCVELRGVEIVRRGEALQLPMINQVVRGQVVGDVEREIAAHAMLRKRGEVLVVAGQKSVCAAFEQLFGDEVLARFEHTRRRHPNLALASILLRSASRARCTASAYLRGSSSSM